MTVHTSSAATIITTTPRTMLLVHLLEPKPRRSGHGLPVPAGRAMSPMPSSMWDRSLGEEYRAMTLAVSVLPGQQRGLSLLWGSLLWGTALGLPLPRRERLRRKDISCIHICTHGHVHIARIRNVGHVHTMARYGWPYRAQDGDGAVIRFGCKYRFDASTEVE